MTHLLLLDTSSLAYRAFFALPSSITDAAGQPVNAVRGYLDMTAQLVREHRPDRIVHVFDDDYRPAPRVAAYPGYKAERPDDPEGLPAQFDLLAKVLDALGGERAVAVGWEADDAIGALCAAAQPDDAVDVVTGDRDLLQLVRDGGPAVRVLFTVKGVKQLAVFDEAGVLERYGVPAARYVDYAILRGDPSDGLPGVKGIGEKTARALVGRYDSLDALLADADGQTPRMAQALHASADYLKAMRAVVPVRADVEVTITRGTRDAAALEELAQRHSIENPVRRLQEALDG